MSLFGFNFLQLPLFGGSSRVPVAKPDPPVSSKPPTIKAPSNTAPPRVRREPTVSPDGEPTAWERVEVELTTGLKSARARVRNGVLHIRVPKRWNARLQQEAIDSLTRRLAHQQQRQSGLLTLAADPDIPRVTLIDPVALRCYVDRVNAATLQAPLAGLRIGSARHSRLAQLNRRTGVMTISRFCLVDVPEPALRYLVIHELAHFEQGNHSAAFWALVGRHCPDYRLQREVIKAFHHRAVAAEFNQDCI